MHRIFISDLHLDDPNSTAFQRFTECLAVEGQRVDEIFILGDLVEMWIGDDDDSDVANALKTTLSGVHAPVFLMHGNRDFMFGKAFAQASNINLLPDPYVTNDGLLLSHGDAYCTDDKAYQTMRETFRSAEWQSQMLSKSLAERKAFGASLRQQSQASNANKAANIMDVNDSAIAQAMRDQHRLLIHGHTHRPGIHLLQDTPNKTRVVLGAWEHCGWLARQREDQVSLECFSLAHRYET